MKGLIEEIRREGNIILVIDEVHNIVGTGDSEGSMNAANILKPALARGDIQVTARPRSRSTASISRRTLRSSAVSSRSISVSRRLPRPPRF